MHFCLSRSGTSHISPSLIDPSGRRYAAVRELPKGWWTNQRASAWCHTAVTGRVPGLIASSRTSFPLIPILSQTLYPGYLEIAFSTDNQLLRLELARLPSPRREDHARSRHTSLQDRNPAHCAHHGRRRLQRQGASCTRSGRPRPPAFAGAEHTPQWQKVCLDDGAGVPGEQRPVQC
jgi:hypothetical protein